MSVRRRIASYHRQTLVLFSLGTFVALAGFIGASHAAKAGIVQPARGYAWALVISTTLLLILVAKTCHSFLSAVREEVVRLERSEEELRRAYGTLNAVFSASPVATVVLDQRLRVTMWNKAAEELVGHRQEEALGLDVATLLGDEAARVCQRLISARPDEPYYDRSIAISRKGGETCDVSLSISTLREGEGAVLGLVLLMVDISERKRVLEALERERIVAERDQVRSTLLAVAAHELRNPMASIKGILSFIRWRVAEGKPVHDMKNKIEVLEREIDRLSQILDEMQEAFQVQEGRLGLAREPVDLGDLLEAAIQLFAEAHERRAFVFEGALPHGVTVRGDARRLEDVFRNILSNAVKYSPPASDIRLRVDVTASEAIVSVTDHGVGIPPEDLPHVFDGFYRGSNVSLRDPGGLGLGLFICKGIVEAHGGTISIESRPAGGTTCRVALPIETATSPSGDETNLSETLRPA